MKKRILLVVRHEPPAVVTVERQPAMCGVANPPFVDGGVFDVHATAAATTAIEACPAG